MCLNLCTYIYGVVGSRARGNDAGKFLVVGPGWKSETPAGIKKVLKCETEFSVIVFRTQLFTPHKESNWLPAPSNENAYIVLRCYWPKEAMLNGSWKAPEMVKVN